MKSKMKIVFFGDSVTEGCFGLYPTSYGFDTYREPEKGYVAKTEARLKALYGEDTVEVINAGVSGNSATKGWERIETDVLAHHPDIVFVCFGLNDVFGTLDRYKNVMSKIFDTLSANKIRPVLLTPNRMCSYLGPGVLPCAEKMAHTAVQFQNEGKMDEFVEAAKELAAARGIPVCDAYARWNEMEKAGIDTTMLLINAINHPNEEMHDLFADMVTETLQSLL